jgi:glycosyltransferase involved in cell wall biosynthesis
MARLLMIAPAASTFFMRDAEALSGKHQVRVLLFRSYPKWKAMLELVRHKLWLLVCLNRYQLVICQFAGYHSFFPVLFGQWFHVPVLIICGGTESVSFPQLRYGNFHKRLLGWFTAYSLRHATHLAPKHITLIEYQYTYDPQQPAHQGIRAFVKTFRTPFTIIPNGYPADIFVPSGKKKLRSFLTVAVGMDLPFTIPLKGIDLILQIAPRFPDCTFTIAGCPKNYKPDVILSNVFWTSINDSQHLLQLYQSHQYYLQLSMSEGFPNAVCEAMLCGCIPVTSSVNALPDIVGNSGFMIHHRHAGELEQTLQKALQADVERLSSQARERIARLFPLSARKEKLIKLVSELIGE